MTFDFDRVIDRRTSDSNKWRKYPADVLPLWVADMDFPSPPAVVQAARASVTTAQAAIARALHHGVVIVSPASSGRSVGAAHSGYRPGKQRRPHNTYRYFP